ncbi:hypothetical protein SAMN05444389_103391, partial [Paracoccus solventivorans]
LPRLPRPTAPYRALPRPTAPYRALPRPTAPYRALPRPTAPYRALPRPTGCGALAGCQHSGLECRVWLFQPLCAAFETRSPVCSPSSPGHPFTTAHFSRFPPAVPRAGAVTPDAPNATHFYASLKRFPLPGGPAGRRPRRERPVTPPHSHACPTPCLAGRRPCPEQPITPTRFSMLPPIEERPLQSGPRSNRRSSSRDRQCPVLHENPVRPAPLRALSPLNLATLSSCYKYPESSRAVEAGDGSENPATQFHGPTRRTVFHEHGRPRPAPPAPPEPPPKTSTARLLALRHRHPPGDHHAPGPPADTARGQPTAPASSSGLPPSPRPASPAA